MFEIPRACILIGTAMIVMRRLNCSHSRKEDLRNIIALFSLRPSPYSILTVSTKRTLKIAVDGAE